MEFNAQLFATYITIKQGDKSLRDVAAESGVSASTLSRLKRGETPDVDTLAQVCTWMDLSPGTFFGALETAPQFKADTGTTTDLKLTCFVDAWGVPHWSIHEIQNGNSA